MPNVRSPTPARHRSFAARRLAKGIFLARLLSTEFRALNAKIKRRQGPNGFYAKGTEIQQPTRSQGVAVCRGSVLVMESRVERDCFLVQRRPRHYR